MPKGATQPIAFRVGSFVVSASANSGNLRTLTTSTATARAIPLSDCVSLILNVTANAADVSARVDVYLDHSWDNGTTWALVEHFAAVTTSTDNQTITFRTTGLGNSESAVRNSTTTGTSVVVVQNMVLAADQRISWVLGSGTTASFTVNAVAMPYGSAGV